MKGVRFGFSYSLIVYWGDLSIACKQHWGRVEIVLSYANPSLMPG